MRLKIIAAAGIVLVCLFASPLAAVAASAPPAVRTETTVTGSELLRGMLRDMSDIEIGSHNATITIEASDGAPHEVRVEYSSLTGGSGGMFSLVGLSIVATAAIRFLGLLLRLGK